MRHRYVGINQFRMKALMDIKSKIEADNSREINSVYKNLEKIRSLKLRNILNINRNNKLLSKRGQRPDTPIPSHQFSVNNFRQKWKNHEIRVVSDVKDKQKKRFKSELRQKLNNALNQFMDSKNSRKSIEEKTIFDKLPPEIIYNIASNLQGKSLLNFKATSKKNFNVVNTHIGFKVIDACHKSISFSSLKEAKTFYTSIISLEHSKIIGDFHAIGNNFVTELNLNNCCFQSSQNLADFLKAFKRLKKVNLCNQVLTKNILFALSENHGLIDINLCSTVIEKGCGLSFVAVLKNCKKLEFLNLSWIKNIETISWIIAEHFPPSLLGLGLAGVGLMYPFNTIGLIELLSKLPELVHLDISDNFYLKNELLQSFPKFLTNLQTLNISRCYSLTIEGLECLDALENIHMINFFNYDSIKEPINLYNLDCLKPVIFNASPWNDLCTPFYDY